MIGGRRRDLGLGGCTFVSLSAARRAAAENRRVARAGGNPTAARTRPTAPSVRAVVEAVIAARRTNWRHRGTERKWRRQFDALVFPRIGDMPVSRVTLDDVRDIIVPHWEGRGSTGYVLRQHLDYVLRWAIAHGHRADNPVEKLKVLLPRVNAVVEHHPSLPYARVAAAVAAVQASSVEETVKLLLVFVVLCASRLGEAIGARWSEIDVVDRLWTLPAERPHEVLRPDLAVVDRLHYDGVGHERSERFHQVERERGAAVARLVVEAAERIEADRGQRHRPRADQ